MILRALVLLLALFASSVSPEVRITGASEVTASELSSAQHAVLDGSVAPRAVALPAPPPPAPQPEPTCDRGPGPMHVTTEVVIVATPRALPSARASAARDQRPAIRRYRPTTSRLDAASPVA